MASFIILLFIIFAPVLIFVVGMKYGDYRFRKKLLDDIFNDRHDLE